MRKQIPGSNDIYITKNGVFTNSDGSQCNVTYLQPDLINFELYGAIRKLYVPWLIRLAMTESNFQNAVDNIEFTECHLSKHHPPHIVTKFKKPVWYDKTHRVVPGYSTVAVDRTGHCISTVTNKPYSIGNGTYLYINAYDPFRTKYRSIVIHILVALAWVENKNPEEYVVVDHLDGNKHNNYYTNLEWVSQQENIRRATHLGLNSSSRKCKIRDVYTHQEYAFSSIQEMLAFLDIPMKESLLNTKPHKLHGKSKNYEIRVSPDERPWFYENKFDQSIKHPKVTRFIVTVDEFGNGDVKTFYGTIELSKYYKIWSNAAKKVSDIVDAIKRQYPLSIVNVTDTFNKGNIEIKDLKSNVIKVFNNTRDAAKYTNRAQSTLLSILKNPECEKNRYGDYVIRYKSDRPWIPDEELTDILKHRCLCYEVESKLTGTIVEYPSLRAVASALNRCRNFVNRCVRESHTNDDVIIRVKQENRSSS